MVLGLFSQGTTQIVHFRVFITVDNLMWCLSTQWHGVLAGSLVVVQGWDPSVVQWFDGTDGLYSSQTLPGVGGQGCGKEGVCPFEEHVYGV